MDNNSSLSSRIIPVILVFFGLILLYYLYQYLFHPNETSYILLSGIQTADVDPTKSIVVGNSKLPAIYEGGEFTVSTWIYITNWGYRSQYYKSILSIGGAEFDTIQLFLGGNRPKLHVRLYTKDSSSTTVIPDGTDDTCSKTRKEVIFETIPTDSGLLDSGPICDLPDLDLQRWVNITVTVNGKTVDVYLDGKLSRSCVLPKFFKVDTSGYAATLLKKGGFGGQIANTVMYDSALNPDRIYHLFMSGPNPINSIIDWLSSIFSINISVNLN
jgi:hypothetical protein